jgi:hypothetical protein
MHERKIWIRYLVEMTGSLLLFALSLVVFIKVGRHMPEGIVRTMIRVSPIPAFLLVMWAMVRQLWRSEVMHQRKIFIRYFLEMLGGFIFYAIVLTFALTVGPSMHHGIGRTLVLVSPMLPFLLVVWAVVRQFRRLDEYFRLISLESIAIAFGVTAGFAVTYGFLENAGFPRLSMFRVWEVMMSVWAVVAIVRSMVGR